MNENLSQSVKLKNTLLFKLELPRWNYKETNLGINCPGIIKNQSKFDTIENMEHWKRSKKRLGIDRIIHKTTVKRTTYFWQFMNRLVLINVFNVEINNCEINYLEFPQLAIFFKEKSSLNIKTKVTTIIVYRIYIFETNKYQNSNIYFNK